MFEITHEELVDAARSDHEARSMQHARNCVVMAVVTSEAIAAELIDQAIAVHANVAKRSNKPQPEPSLPPRRRSAAATCHEDTVPGLELRLPAG
jgi:hypothetical protein